MAYRVRGENQGPARHTLTADFLIRRAHKAYQKYCQSGKRKHIHYAIELATGAIRRTIAPRPGWSANLAHYLDTRYEKLRRVSDLDAAVLVVQRGIAAAKEDYQRKAFLLNTLAHLLLSRYTRRKTFSDLERAVQAAEEAVATIPRQSWSAKPVLLNTLASAWNHVYTHTRKSLSLDFAIQAAQAAASCSTLNDPNQSLLLHNYSVILNRRFNLQGNVFDLQEAISATERAVLCLVDGHPLKPELLNDLGANLNSYFERTKRTTELDKAIRVGKQAVELVPGDSPRKAIYLGNLSNSLVSRHRLNSCLTDLEEAVRISEAATQAIPEGHESETEIRHNLAARQTDMYHWTREDKYLDLAIELMRQSLNSTPRNHDAYASRHDDLATLLFLQFEKTGMLASLNDAIKLSKRSVRATAATHPDQSIYLSNLGNHYASLYDRTKKMAHLRLALTFIQGALKYAQESCLIYSTVIGQLGGIFERYYERSGCLLLLQDAILFTTDAAEASPKNSLEKAARLCDLGNLLEIQYLRTGAMSDLDEAIAKSEEAIQITPRDHADLPGRLNNLAIKLKAQYTRSGLDHTINKAIDHATRAVELTACDHLDWAMYASTLATLHHSRYENSRNEKSRQQQDLAKAIEYERKACSATPNDHELRMTYQHNLGISLSTLYEETSNEAYLSEAIDLIMEAANLAPTGSPLQAGRKNTLASLLETRYSKAEETGKRGEILSIALDVWKCTAAVPFERIRAGYRALRMFAEELQSEAPIGDENIFATKSDSATLHRALRLGGAMLDLLPVVHTRYLNRDDQQFVISSFSGVASLAACLFLIAGKVAEAVECLERGRTVIINQLLSDREDVSKLRRTHPALATKYTQLVAELNMNPPSSSQSSGANTRRRDAVKELDACIAAIRAVSGSSTMHLAQSVSEMQQNIGTRRVIIVNVTNFGSHAIIVSSDTLFSMKLPKLTASETKKQFDRNWVQRYPKKQSEKNEQLVQALEWLWEACVGPVLLKISPAPGTMVEDLPRVWWIGTGLASSLPFHAADSRQTDLTSNAFSWVVSSYTPSVMSLIHAIQHDIKRRSRKEGKGRLLLATMPTTPSAARSYADLQADKEASSVMQSVGSQMEVELLEHPNVEQISGMLKICYIAHFACHGEVDRRDPSNTALILQRDGANGNFNQDLLTAQKISELKLEHAHIAYLSACSTAENRAQNLTDEVIHLASGFLVAGFPNVIGSLWGAPDAACAKLATYFYTQLFDERRSDIAQDVAVALHRAIRRLRTAKPDAPANWAQFVHWGV